MRKFTLSLAVLATTACSAAPSEHPDGEHTASRFSLRTAAAETTDPWACDDTGVFRDAAGNVIACFKGVGSAAMAVGDDDLIFGGLGQNDILSAECRVETTADGLGVLEGCSAMAAKTKADILIESLGN